MKVVILAGGHGSRLSEETTLKPKPMVEIGGRPILWHIMKSYAAAVNGTRGASPRRSGLLRHRDVSLAVLSASWDCTVRVWQFGGEPSSSVVCRGAVWPLDHR